MNYNDDSVHIGVKKRKPKPDHISHIIEAMPIPSAWNISQPVAKGKGNLRLTKGVIRFVKLDISIADRLPRETQEYVPDVSPVDFDPADRILKKNQKRSVHSRESNIDLFDLERRIKSDRYVDSGRFSGNGDRRLAASKYRSRKDAERIRADLSSMSKRLKFNLFEISIITAFLVTVDVLPNAGVYLPGICTADGFTMVYLLISLIGLVLASIILFADLKEGIRSLFSRSFSTLTTLSVAASAEIMHIIYMLAAYFIAQKPVYGTFAAPVCVSLLIYTINRMIHTSRISHGFAFTSKRGIYSAVMSADDSPIAADLRHASGVRSAKIAYVVRTKHLSNYFFNACREDKSSLMMSGLYPVILIASVVAAAIAAVRGIFTDSDPVNVAFSALCSILVIGVPITGMLNLEAPLARLSKRLRRSGALLTGWNAVDKFGGTDAFAINTTDLFPRGSIRVRRSFAINDMEIEEITSIAASVLLGSGGALAEVFGELIRDDARLRQRVDSITYETELGISAWVKDKKVLIGNANMMRLHRVLIPGGGLARLDEFEAMRKNECYQMLYVAVNNRLMGVYMLEYKAAMSARNAMLQLIEEGTGIMIYTCDANININLIKSVFGIPPRFISILDNEGSRIYDSVTYRVTRSQSALIVTDGTLRALSDVIRAAVVLKDTEGVSVTIQGICFAMGLIFVAGLSCISPYAIDSMEILIMQLIFLLLSTVSILKVIRL
ncbi:MAG: hypothetical protein IIZ08_04125 [Clostridia bacterium]|nr:hypothetical protein [Clostridia bacterium]